MVELEHPNIRFLCYFDSYLTERTHSLELQAKRAIITVASTGEVRERK